MRQHRVAKGSPPIDKVSQFRGTVCGTERWGEDSERVGWEHFNNSMHSALA